MRIRDLALFNLAIDSKLRGCDQVNLRVRDIVHGNQVQPRAMVVQSKTQRPVQFELTDQTRSAGAAWIAKAELKLDQYLFPSRAQILPMFQPGNKPESCTDGWVLSASIRQPMARTRCGRLRQP